ncbi:hypothetical protein [Nostocoides vanveenii]|uniref:DNA-binding protein n=1 Tax=Nostocoides vanveenii TaxID=330835 RepID=A0ABN2KMX3_9MICO
MSKDQKTLAIRLDAEQHARLSILAKLTGATVTDVIRDAVTVHLAGLASNPEVAAKAEALQAEIEAEASAQRAALAELFGKVAATPTTARSSRR